MSFSHARHPLWQSSLDLVFDCFLTFGTQPTGNPILERCRRATSAYTRALEIALRQDYRTLAAARNLLVQLRNNLMLAKDLGLIDRDLFLRAKQHFARLARCYRDLGR